MSISNPNEIDNALITAERPLRDAFLLARSILRMVARGTSLATSQHDAQNWLAKYDAPT